MPDYEAMGRRPRTVTGAQLHHGVDLGDACRSAHGAAAALEAAIVKSDDPDLVDLHRRAVELSRQVGRAEEARSERMRDMRRESPDLLSAAFEGDVPYPDERQDGLMPRCRCRDRCLWHDVTGGEGLPPAGTVCNCSVYCFRHKRVRGMDEGS